jgi:ATP-dependent protease Clp ATPase subunit
MVKITAIGTASNTPIKPNTNHPNNIQIKINNAETHNVLFMIIGVNTLFSD